MGAKASKGCQPLKEGSRGDPWPDVPEARRAVMRAVKGKDTKPEMIVRRLVHDMGYRYRLHRKDLPGKPDLAFGPRKKAIFVHGCFWHQHSDAGCRGARMPATRLDYWRPKLERNKARDERAITDLVRLGWRVLVVWECWLKDTRQTATILTGFLDGVETVGEHGGPSMPPIASSAVAAFGSCLETETHARRAER